MSPLRRSQTSVHRLRGLLLNRLSSLPLLARRGLLLAAVIPIARAASAAITRHSGGARAGRPIRQIRAAAIVLRAVRRELQLLPDPLLGVFDGGARAGDGRARMQAGARGLVVIARPAAPEVRVDIRIRRRERGGELRCRRGASLRLEVLRRVSEGLRRGRTGAEERTEVCALEASSKSCWL
jgi:hypothetical protein